MLRLKAERRSLAKVSGASASESRITKTPDVVHSTTTHHQRHPHAPVRFPVRTSNAAAWALFTLVVGTILIATCVVLTLGWPS